MESLPLEAWWCIFQFLDFVDLVKLSLVCSQWRDLSLDDQFWKSLCSRRNWKNKSKTWRHCFQQNLKSLKLLNKRLAPGLDDFLMLLGHLYSNGGAETSSCNCVELCKEYFKNNNNNDFDESMQEISWMISSCGFRILRSTMLECCVVEKTMAIPILDVVDLIMNLKHRVLWDQAMYAGTTLQKFVEHEDYSTNSPTSIPTGFESIADIKLLQVDTADMFWSVGTRDELELLQLRCFRGIYTIADDGLLLLEEGIGGEEDSIFTEPFPQTITCHEDEVLKQESSTLFHYKTADRFAVRGTGFFLQRMDESSTKIIYLIQLVTDEFDSMVLDVRHRLRALALTRMEHYYRTSMYRDIKNGNTVPINHEES